jgi:ssDNA thymidine ADP-ribosyltransferase, DarT
MPNHYPNLNADKALIWRIVHRDNLPWLLANGLHCRSSTQVDPGYVNIGNTDLIGKRAHRAVPIAPGGTLADYVPFYFTPFSVMMKNIHTGWGVPPRANEEIVILVSSLHRLLELGLPFVFTNGHAYPPDARFFSDLADLRHIDWGILRARDFKRDLDDPKKLDRYQAEALVHRYLPVQALLGIVCYTETLKADLQARIETAGAALPVHARKGWYF